jgi:hypothetical protein
MLVYVAADRPVGEREREREKENKSKKSLHPRSHPYGDN